MWGNAEAMDCLSSKITCPLESTVLEGWNNEKAPHSVGKQPLPLYGWNEASPQHVHVPL